MKLNEVSRVSWGLSMLSGCLCVYLSYQAYDFIHHLKGPSYDGFVFEVVEQDLKQDRFGLGRESLLSALVPLTKLEHFQVLDDQPDKPKKQEVIKQPKAGPKLDLVPEFVSGLKVTLISFDDERQRHLAFLKHKNSPSHPYSLGEELPSKPVTYLKDIHRDHIMVESKDGRTKKLYVHSIYKRP